MCKGFEENVQILMYVQGFQGIVVVSMAICEGFKEKVFDFCLSCRCVQGFLGTFQISSLCARSL